MVYTAHKISILHPGIINTEGGYYAVYQHIIQIINYNLSFACPYFCRYPVLSHSGYLQRFPP